MLDEFGFEEEEFDNGYYELSDNIICMEDEDGYNDMIAYDSDENPHVLNIMNTKDVLDYLIFNEDYSIVNEILDILVRIDAGCNA